MIPINLKVRVSQIDYDKEVWITVEAPSGAEQYIGVYPLEAEEARAGESVEIRFNSMDFPDIDKEITYVPAEYSETEIHIEEVINVLEEAHALAEFYEEEDIDHRVLNLIDKLKGAREEVS